jgi:hypothetical protein
VLPRGFRHQQGDDRARGEERRANRERGGQPGRATPSPLMLPQMPSARPRPAGGVASDSSVSVSGKTIAAPAPAVLVS